MPTTVGEIFGVVYGGVARWLVGALWVIFCAGLIGAQLSAIGLLLTSYLSYSLPTCTFIGTALLLSYCSLGGVRTDLSMVVLMVVARPFLALVSLTSVEASPDIVAPEQMSSLQVLMLFLTFFVGDLFVPPMVQRMVMAPSVAAARRSFTRAACVLLPFCFTGCLMGIVARTADPTLSSTESLPYLLSSFLPIGARLLALVGFLAAILTSANSYLHTALVAVVCDLFRVKSDGVAVRFSSVAICGVALLLAAQGPGAIILLLGTFSFWGPTIVVPLFACLFNRPLPRWAFFTSVGVGIGSLTLWQVAGLEEHFGIGGIIPAMMANALFSVALLLPNRKIALIR